MAPGPLLYLDDLQAGQVYVTGTHTIDDAQITRFAQEFDPQPFHLDPDAATFGPFGAISASGWHTAAITMRLVVEGVPVAGGIVGAGGEIAWTKPVRPGDTLRVHVEVVEVKPSRSRPERGIVTIRCETRNQHDEPVQIFVARIFAPRRPVPPR
jgi:acyl dehydratase